MFVMLEEIDFIPFGHLKMDRIDQWQKRMAIPSYSFQHYPTTALYRTLITTAWFKKIKKSCGLAAETGERGKNINTPRPEKWQQHRQKQQQQQRTWKEANKGTKTYLRGQREHHHPLGFELNPPPPPHPLVAHIHAHRFPCSPTHWKTHPLLWPIVVQSNQTAGCRSHQYLICFRELTACNRG